VQDLILKLSVDWVQLLLVNNVAILLGIIDVVETPFQG